MDRARSGESIQFSNNTYKAYISDTILVYWEHFNKEQQAELVTLLQADKLTLAEYKELPYFIALSATVFTF